ncbi:MAG: glycosyltransferase [Gammaproteobacteria bacterium]
MCGNPHITPAQRPRRVVEALGVLTDRSWRLDCVGSTEHHPPTRSALAAQVRRLGLTQRVAFHGEIQPASLAEYYRHADVFVLPSHYEGYGMALAEALAYGLPIVSTTAGAIPDTVPAAAGLLLPPGDIVTLAAALARIMDDRTLRKRLASGARAARALLPAWPVACARFAAELAMACGTKAPVNA